MSGVLELVHYLGCLPLALGLASAHALIQGTASPAEFLPPRSLSPLGGQSSLLNNARFSVRTLMLPPFNELYSPALSLCVVLEQLAIITMLGGIP
jgi:hypothetical protein